MENVTFWFMMLIVIIGFYILFGGSEVLVRKMVGADKKKVLSYNHVNDLHKRVDKGLRIASVTIILLIGILTRNLVLFTMLPFVMLVLLEWLRTYMEWKFAENRGNYKVSLVQASLLSVISATVIMYSSHLM